MDVVAFLNSPAVTEDLLLCAASTLASVRQKRIYECRISYMIIRIRIILILINGYITYGYPVVCPPYLTCVVLCGRWLLRAWLLVSLFAVAQLHP